MKTAPLALEITPEQVSSIQTLKGKQLHITLSEVTSIGSVIKDYEDIIAKFLEDNMATNITIKIKTILLLSGIHVSIVIISIDNTYVN